MSLAYKSRGGASELVIAKGDTFGAVLDKKGLRAKWELVARYNWGTKEPAEVNRALIELVGCESFAPDPLNTVLDPARGTGGKILEPELWAPTLDIAKTHTVKVKKRLPVPGVCIDSLTALFKPGTENCDVAYLLEGDPERVKTTDLEIHVAAYWGLTGRSSPSAPAPDKEEFVTSYYDEVQAKDDRQGPEIVEKPVGTMERKKLKETHLLSKSEDKPRGPLTFAWDGKSKATEGILKSDAFINSRCAPYLVSVRYYKDPADKTAILRLKPFYPQWKLTGKNMWDLREDSLTVEWKVEGEDASKAKLTHGQIRLYDKDGLVFFAPLTADQIKAGKYGLLTEAIKWDKSKLDMKKLPYRVQLQVHSGDGEDNGLALAVMPTQVPAYNYEQVQFVGYDACNNTDSTGAEYLGDDDDATDIDFRVAAMIEAIEKAKPDVDPDRKILKVFVAPEFYFRGKKGAYAFEKISTIVPKLRKETDKYDYLDWWFVFGTALGSHSHEATGAAIEHGNAIHLLRIDNIDSATQITATVWSAPRQGWALHTQNGQEKTIAAPPVWPVDLDKVTFPSSVKLTLDDTTGLVTNTDKVDAWVIEPVMTILDTDPSGASPTKKIVVASAICSQIAVEPITNKVITVGGTFWEVESEGVKRRVTHAEFNTALKQFTLTLAITAPFKAGKPLILREPKTVEIFNVALMQKGWNAPHLGDGSLREVITYKEDMSHIDYIRDAGISGGAFYNPTGVNRKIRMNYQNDVPFLPTSGGKDIGGASPNVVRQPGGNVGSEINESGLGGGCVIMVDRVTMGVEVCRDHCVYRLFNFYTGPNVRAGDPLVQVQLIPSWGMSIGLVSDRGKEVTALRDALVFNVDGPRMSAVARVWDTTYSCDDHVTVAKTSPGNCDVQSTTWYSGALWYECDQHSTKPKWFSGGPCPTHGAMVCEKPYQQMGSAFAATANTDVPKSNNTKYFSSQGIVRVFPAKPVPSADVVTAPPVLNTISTSNLQQGISTTVNIKGSGLANARYVKVDGPGVVMTDIWPISDSEVNAKLHITNTAPIGPRNLTVSSLSGTSPVAIAVNVVARAAPAIVSITPNEGVLLGVYTVVVRGSNFATCSSIVSTDPEIDIEIISFADNKIDLKVTVKHAATVGNAPITVTTLGGAASATFNVKARPLPEIHAVSVTDFLPMYSYTGVVVTGAWLALTDDVNVASGELDITNFTIDSDGQLTIDIDVEKTATIGVHELVITTLSGDSLPFNLNVIPHPVPTLTGISPVSAYAGFPKKFKVAGTELSTLQSARTTTVGVVPKKLENVTDTDFDFIVDIGDAAALGPCQVFATTLGGEAGPVSFNILARPAPTLFSLSRTTGTCSMLTRLTISGSFLSAPTAISVSGGGVTVSAPSRATDGAIDVSITVAIDAEQTERDLTVTTPGGVSNPLKFKIIPRNPPTITGMVPNRVPANSGGGCRIEGNDFAESGTITCSTDKITVTNVNRVNSNQVNFTIAVAADTPIGTHTFTYTNRFGSATTTLQVHA